MAKVVDIALHELPDMESRLEQTTRAAAMKEVDLEHLENRIHTLKEEEKRKRMVTMSYHNYYYYVDNRQSCNESFSLLS